MTSLHRASSVQLKKQLFHEGQIYLSPEKDRQVVYDRDLKQCLSFVGDQLDAPELEDLKRQWTSHDYVSFVRVRIKTRSSSFDLYKQRAMFPRKLVWKQGQAFYESIQMYGSLERTSGGLFIRVEDKPCPHSAECTTSCSCFNLAPYLSDSSILSAILREKSTTKRLPVCLTISETGLVSANKCDSRKCTDEINRQMKPPAIILHQTAAQHTQPQWTQGSGMTLARGWGSIQQPIAGSASQPESGQSPAAWYVARVIRTRDKPYTERPWSFDIDLIWLPEDGQSRPAQRIAIPDVILSALTRKSFESETSTDRELTNNKVYCAQLVSLRNKPPQQEGTLHDFSRKGEVDCIVDTPLKESLQGVFARAPGGNRGTVTLLEQRAGRPIISRIAGTKNASTLTDFPSGTRVQCTFDLKTGGISMSKDNASS